LTKFVFNSFLLKFHVFITTTMGTSNGCRMLLCAEVNAQDFYVVHHEMGHVEYYMAYRNQPTVFQVYSPQTAVINTLQTDGLVPLLCIQES
jgi:hypothetical protein